MVSPRGAADGGEAGNNVRGTESSGFVLARESVTIAQRLGDFDDFSRANPGNHGIVTGARAVARLANS